MVVNSSRNGGAKDTWVVGQMPSRPLIGVTTSEVRRSDKPTDHGEPPQREMTLGLSYLRAVELAGGLPVVLPPLGADAIPAAARAPRRRLPVRRPRPAPGRLPPRAAPRAGPGVAVARRLRDRARPPRRRPRPARSSASAAAPRRSTSSAAGRCTSTSPTSPTGRSSTARPRPARRTTHEVVLQPDSAVARVLGGDAGGRQLLPPPGRRRARRPACAAVAPRAGRRRRGDRGDRPAALPRRAVARGDARRPTGPPVAVRRPRRLPPRADDAWPCFRRWAAWNPAAAAPTLLRGHRGGGHAARAGRLEPRLPRRRRARRRRPRAARAPRAGDARVRGRAAHRPLRRRATAPSPSSAVCAARLRDTLDGIGLRAGGRRHAPVRHLARRPRLRGRAPAGGPRLHARAGAPRADLRAARPRRRSPDPEVARCAR